MTSTDQYTVDTVIRRTFKTLADHPGKFLLPALIVYIPVGLIAAFDAENGTFTALTVISSVLGFLAPFGLYAYFSVVASELSSGNDVDVARAFDKTIKKIGQIIVVSIVSGIAVVIGTMLLIAPGLYLATIWFVFIPALVLEDKGYFDSLGRSRELVRGSGWSVFVTFLFTYVVAIVIFIILYFLASVIASDGSLLMSWVIFTLGAGASVIVVGVIMYFAYEQLVPLKGEPQSSPDQLNLETDTQPQTGTAPPTNVPPPPDVPPPTEAPPPTDVPPPDDQPRA